MRLTFILLLISLVANAQDTTRVKLLFVGDVMQHDSQIRAALDARSGTYDYSECFEYIKPAVQSADLAIANLEVTLAGPPHKGYPQFSAPDELAVELKETGFDVLVTSNNHSLDRRKAGLERTINVLDSLEILHTGTFKDSASRSQRYPLVVSSNGMSFSLLNYTYGTNGIPITKPNVVNLIDTVQIKLDLYAARDQNTDAIIVFMHWGDEYKDQPNKAQKSLANFCFEKGATMVIGSHPHVLQPMEWRKEKNQVVAYSLGNFVSGQQSRYRDGGAMLWVELEKIKSDSSSSVKIREASYELAWVYRNMESPKKYFILPLKEFEVDTIRINEQTARTNFKLFVSDSRKLMEENRYISESKRVPAESSYYKIVLADASHSTVISDTAHLFSFYDMHTEQVNDSLWQWTTSKFFDREIAEQALNQIRSATEFKEAKLMWFYWSRREELSSSK